MKMLIRSYNRPGTITTPEVPTFADLDRIVLLHDGDPRYGYADVAAGRDRTYFITGVEPGPGGATLQLEAGLRSLVKPGEWVVVADDDIREVQAVPMPWYVDHVLDVHRADAAPEPEGWDALYKTPADAEMFAMIVRDSIANAERIGSHVVGFGTTRNFYFRSRKWRSVGYVMGGLRLWRYDPSYIFDPSISMDDFRESAEQLRRYGTVLINNYVHAVCGMYIDGGLGRREDRLADRERDLEALERAYPGLFRVNRKDGYPDLRIRFTSEAQVERWRRFA